MLNKLCPYCTREIGTEGVIPSIEHVFPDYVGGRVTVSACKECNNTIGTEIEGTLSKPPALFAFQAGIRSGDGPVVRFEYDGRRMEVDWSTGEHRGRDLVERSKDGNIETFQVGGPEEQVRGIVEGIARKHNMDPEQMMAMGKTELIEEIEANLDPMLALEARLAAKVALAAGTFNYGDAFIKSELAEALRAITNGDEALWVDPQTIPFWTTSPLVPVEPDGRRCLLVDVPASEGVAARTLVLVHLLGREVPCGLALLVYADAPAPVTMVYEGDSDHPAVTLGGFVERFVELPAEEPEWAEVDEPGPHFLDPIAPPDGAEPG